MFKSCSKSPTRGKRATKFEVGRSTIFTHGISKKTSHVFRSIFWHGSSDQHKIPNNTKFVFFFVVEYMVLGVETKSNETISHNHNSEFNCTKSNETNFFWY